jgi:hypothetical protein
MREQLASVLNEEGLWLSKWWEGMTEPLWTVDWRKAALFPACDDGEFRELDRAMDMHGGFSVTLWLTDEGVET